MTGINVRINSLEIYRQACMFFNLGQFSDGGRVDRVDLDILAKICYMFDCDICDFMRYVKPKRK